MICDIWPTPKERLLALIGDFESISRLPTFFLLDDLCRKIVRMDFKTLRYLLFDYGLNIGTASFAFS